MKIGKSNYEPSSLYLFNRTWT